MVPAELDGLLPSLPFPLFRGKDRRKKELVRHSSRWEGNSDIPFFFFFFPLSFRGRESKGALDIG